MRSLLATPWFGCNGGEARASSDDCLCRVARAAGSKNEVEYLESFMK